ncbi:hypothetical protein VA7868_01489 [Vibrio aerogenes CECT 7868]|uniref:Baseplate protein J-like domain-containing protein n=1 Tax=Vibrio aerogenes CECT 7868 TaxID=1216006 RepID=A0A1M5Y4N3_9VIBR|nr:hypothetical protein [Vibrio aerogenes]SHI06962.1 hypothetical protein VA7868_01489 [Vibrio aerogenes CECT 7868]
MTTRQERAIPALSPGFFQLHELSFEQLLVWARQFARMLPYRDSDDQEAGNWEGMFAQSELVVCATILSIDLHDCQHHFRQAKQLGAQPALTYLLHLCQQMNQWYTWLPDAPALAFELKSVLLHSYQTRLTTPLQQLIGSLPAETCPDLSRFDPLWGLTEVAATAGQADHLQHCFSRVILTLAALQQECRDLLKRAQTHGETPPQLALYASFLKLFQRAQQKINQLTQNHLTFYYRDVLKQAAKPAPGDRVWLKLSLPSNRHTPIGVEPGDIFSPGLDAQFHRIDYQATQPLLVTNAEVTQAFHLTFRRDPLVSPERVTGFVCGVHGSRTTINPASTGAALPQTQAFPLFSSDQQAPRHSGVHQEVTSQQDAPRQNAVLSQDESGLQTMGLVIADPVFLMAEGERQVTLHFRLHEIRSNLIVQLVQMLGHEPGNTAPDEAVIRHTLTLIFEQLLLTHGHLLGDERRHIDPVRLVALLSHDDINALYRHSPAEQFDDVYRCFFLTLLYQTRDQETFFRLFGQLICRHTLSSRHWLSRQEKRLIWRKAKTLHRTARIDTIALETLQGLLRHAKVTVFYQLFSKIFDFQITTTEGWETIKDTQIHPLKSSLSRQKGFVLTFNLSPGFSATIPPEPALHGAHWHLKHPALKLTLKAQANCFPYSIFRDFELATVNITSEVQGVARFKLFNPDGQADPGQPFFMFGVQPTDESALVIASEELARKQLQALTFHLNWSGLPRGSDGFRQHYHGYPFAYHNHSFQVATEVLSNGRWQPLGQHRQPLFGPARGQLNKATQLHIATMQQAFTPVTHAWPQAPFSHQSGLRNGLFKIRLIQPQTAFGHHLYGPLFSQVLTDNARRKKWLPEKALSGKVLPGTLLVNTVLPVPNAPYTPVVNQLSIDYRAHSRVDLTSLHRHHPAQVIHLHPFGQEQVYPPADPQRYQPPRLLPDYQHDSHLFIGIDATELSGYLNLYFLLGDQSGLLTPFASTCYHWQYLVGDEWRTLPAKHMIEDTTQGFLTSGLITLDIPDAINTTHRVMPDGHFWLRVSTSDGIGLYPRCRHIATHVIAVDGTCEPRRENLFSDWQRFPGQSGTGPLIQLTPMGQLPAQETRPQWITRVSEQLRHKGQAITPWDYEHLVLEAFDTIGAADCFPHSRFDSHQPQAGHVLMIVRPAKTACDHMPCQPKVLDAATLLAIRDYLRSVSRPGCQIEVRNPGFETIQVRCFVCFHSGVHHGLAQRELNHKLNHTLCPWHTDSMNTGLGWQLSLNKLAAFIGQQPDVASVSGVSVLKISQQQQTGYTLQDSAVTQQPVTAGYPWNLLIPAAHHSLQIISKPAQHAPQPAGIGELVIGEQLIIDSSVHPFRGTTKGAD